MLASVTLISFFLYFSICDYRARSDGIERPCQAVALKRCRARHLDAVKLCGGRSLQLAALGRETENLPATVWNG